MGRPPARSCKAQDSPEFSDRTTLTRRLQSLAFCRIICRAIAEIAGAKTEDSGMRGRAKVSGLLLIGVGAVVGVVGIIIALAGPASDGVPDLIPAAAPIPPPPLGFVPDRTVRRQTRFGEAAQGFRRGGSS